MGKDCFEGKLMSQPQRNTLKSGVRSAMCVATQVSGSPGFLVWWPFWSVHRTVCANLVEGIMRNISVKLF